MVKRVSDDDSCPRCSMNRDFLLDWVEPTEEEVDAITIPDQQTIEFTDDELRVARESWTDDGNSVADEDKEQRDSYILYLSFKNRGLLNAYPRGTMLVFNRDYGLIGADRDPERAWRTANYLFALNRIHAVHDVRWREPLPKYYMRAMCRSTGGACASKMATRGTKKQAGHSDASVYALEDGAHLNCGNARDKNERTWAAMDMLLDTGSNFTHINERRGRRRSALNYDCSCGKKKSMPCVKTRVRVKGRTFCIEAGVGTQAILGTDILFEFDHNIQRRSNPNRNHKRQFWKIIP